jgi:putative ABC transport system ATP-binding protein
LATVLKIRNLSKSYLTGKEELHILKSIDLDIQSGEVIAIQGPSGCGKSTLISVVAGLDSFSQGEVEILGRQMKDMKSNQWNQFRAENIGIIFQQFHLLEHLTAIENIRLPLDLRSDPDADQLADQALVKVGLKDRANHFQRELSRGESQRVAIARVLVMKPKLILADEPTASLDVKTGVGVSQMIFKLAREQNMAALIVTHDPSIADLCDRTYVMRDGVLELKSIDRPNI